jgi:hypothetical protein
MTNSLRKTKEGGPDLVVLCGEKIGTLGGRLRLNR